MIALVIDKKKYVVVDQREYDRLLESCIKKTCGSCAVPARGILNQILFPPLP